MHIRTAALALSLALLPLTACSNDKPDVAACKTAMRKQYEAAIASGEQGTKPTACQGVDDATLQRLAGEVLTEQLEQGVPTPTP